MEVIQDPALQKKIDEIRQTLQTLGTSFTEEDQSSSCEQIKNSSYTQALDPQSPQISIKSPTRNAKFNSDPKLPISSICKVNEKDLKILRLQEKNQELVQTSAILNSIINNKDQEIQSLKSLVETMTVQQNQLQSSLKYMRSHELELKSEITHLKLKLSELDYKHQTPVPRHKNNRQDSPASPNPFELKKFNFERLKIPEKLSASPPLTARNKSSKWIVQEVMKVLSVESTDDLMSKLSHLKSHHSKYKKSKQIVDNISKMMVQCSPEGTFKTSPSEKQVWKWITRLLEEYMKLKQSLAGELLYKMKEMLKVKDLDQMPEALKALLYKLN